MVEPSSSWQFVRNTNFKTNYFCGILCMLELTMVHFAESLRDNNQTIAFSGDFAHGGNQNAAFHSRFDQTHIKRETHFRGSLSGIGAGCRMSECT